MVPQTVTNLLHENGYICDTDLATAVSLMLSLGKPLLLEGEAGVGKTEIARSLAHVLHTELIRLQCYEGLDTHQALYDWDYPRQLLAIQTAKANDQVADENTLYSDRYLLKRPLLNAISRPQPAVLLIDEVDRADEEFEAFLLELLSDFQVTIPELGTIRATSIPHIVLTSNRVRELSDALRRRCLYHYIEFPDPSRELDILRARLPDIDQKLAEQIVQFVQTLRLHYLRKTPGVAESIDWAAALLKLSITDFTLIN